MCDLALLKPIQACLAARARGECHSAVEAIALQDFVKSHDPMIRAITSNCHVNPRDVDDLVQDVWCAFFENLPALELDPALRTLDDWVAAIVRNQARKHARRKSTHRNEVLTPELAEVLLDPGAGPNTEFERRQQQDQVRAIVEKLGSRLPALSHRIIVMGFINEQSVAAIAAELGLTVDRVGAILRRARLKLAVLLLRAGLSPL